MKSKRNKTIDFPLEEAQKYIENCLTEKDSSSPVNKTLLGDLFKCINKVEDGSVDLLIVDPPYNLNKNFHGNAFKESDGEVYAEYTEKWIKAVLPKLKKTASIYVCCDWKSSLVIGAVLQKYFILRNRITWQREKGRGAKSNWKNGLEDVFFATVSEEYTFNLNAVKVRKKVLAPYKENGVPKDWEKTDNGNYRNTCPSNFWDDIAIPYWSMPENTAHPTQKPEKLIAKLILASSNAGDLVLDPFAGSGTTGVVAKKLGRNYIDIEQNPLYCGWAEYRLQNCNQGDRIQGYEDGIFWERNTPPSKPKMKKGKKV
ncbi:MAG: site-specific DNA-methyltransferase [Clostridia bacterium]|nr:site-specific DNA-methyltransferase [Clostridia bacterium]